MMLFLVTCCAIDTHINHVYVISDHVWCIMKKCKKCMSWFIDIKVDRHAKIKSTYCNIDSKKKSNDSRWAICDQHPVLCSVMGMSQHLCIISEAVFVPVSWGDQKRDCMQFILCLKLICCCPCLLRIDSITDQNFLTLRSLRLFQSKQWGIFFIH